MIYTELKEIKKMSKICFGTLALSNLQNNECLEQKVSVLDYAYEKGINFYDTAELYDNYDILGKFMQNKRRDSLYIATKSYAYNKETAKYSIEKALKELNTDYIDIFMLHEQDNGNNFRGHYEAVQEFMKYKSQGIIKRFGISTHAIQAVNDSVEFDEIDIVFTIMNSTGIGINDGTKEKMLDAIKYAKANGKFIMAMKPYGGGHLINDTYNAFNFVNNIKEIDSIAVGMKNKSEVDVNINYLENKPITEELKKSVRDTKRTLCIAYWCEGCGKCVKRCKQNALSIVDGKCTVDMSKCVLCSYCASACDSFCIKIV
ncbi:aldo/keto reductase [Sedimentibacter sp. zth1]|uniref:aldo/keto reductase n=1 Tax=Sedimentibacter sp. zth1 TaxID=2816908 RepID=UPI001A92EFAD|nr:aldo/keto reductase [Sedimentibacter sp. zth1]QSX06435.1 aldo/keto reductase [Sedimentibacter sp. zth1]